MYQNQRLWWYVRAVNEFRRDPPDIRPMDLLVFHFVYALSDSAKKSLNVTPSAAQIRSIVGTPN